MQLNVTKWAKELGIHKDTLAKGLIRAGLDVQPGSKFTLLEIIKGYCGDLKTEQTRKTRAEADAKEVENKVRMRELIPMTEACEQMNTLAALCRAEINGFPGCAGRVTPHDPNASKPILEEYRDRAVTNINACLANKQSNS